MKAPNVPVITIRPGETHLAVDRAFALLVASRPRWVVVGHTLFEVGPQPNDPRSYPDFWLVKSPALRARLAELAIWQRESPAGKVTRIDPPAAVAAAILALKHEWPWRRLVQFTPDPFRELAH
jgi:hypothetical protein